MSTCMHRSDAPFDHTPRRRSRAPRSPLPQRWASAAPTTRVVLKLRPARACIGGASSDAISGMQSLNGNPYNHSPRRAPDGNQCSTQWQSTHSSISITSPHQVCNQRQSPPLIKRELHERRRLMPPCRTVKGVEARARYGVRCMRRVRAHRDLNEIESAARGLDDVECGVDEARVEQVPLQPNHS